MTISCSDLQVHFVSPSQRMQSRLIQVIAYIGENNIITNKCKEEEELFFDLCSDSNIFITNKCTFFGTSQVHLFVREWSGVEGEGR